MPTTSLSHAAFCGYGFRPRASRAPERRPGNDVRDVGLRLHGLEQDAFESSKGWARSLVMTEPTQSAPNPAAPEAAITAALGKRLIVLVGMMGVGKSTVGRRLAARLRRRAAHGGHAHRGRGAHTAPGVQHAPKRGAHAEHAAS